MFNRVRELDRPLLGVTVALALFGLAALYSAGQTDVPTQVTTIWQRQIAFLVLGAVLAGLVFRASPRLVEWAAPYVYGGALFLLLLTLVIGTGAGTAAGTKSWIVLGGPFRLQPAELAKLAVVLMVARWAADRRSPPATMRELMTPGVIVLVAILFAMLYWVGTRPALLLLLVSPAVGLILAFSTAAWGAWFLLILGLVLWWRIYLWEAVAVVTANLIMGVVALPFWRSLAPYQQNRVLAFLNPLVDPRATGWHVIQSRVAIGSGGFLGKGYTLGSQKRLAFLPAQHTDFIFSVVGEELGFVGVVAALTLFITLILVLLRIARRATDQFSSLVVFGITGMLFTHIVENVGMTVNLLPITGIPLPFFSYGGSFLVTCCAAIGVALRVAWESRLSGYTER